MVFLDFYRYVCPDQEHPTRPRLIVDDVLLQFYCCILFWGEAWWFV